MNAAQRPDAHNQWYGYNNAYNQQPPPGYPLRPPQRWPAQPHHAPGNRGRPRKCNIMYAILRQLSLILPVILVVVVAYVYIQDAHWRGSSLPAGSSALVPLYLSIPVAVANIVWCFTIMITRKRSHYRGWPIPQWAHFVTEMVLAAGAAVCFSLMVVTLHSRGGERSWSEGYLPLSYHQSMAWLLGMQMICNGLLCARAGLEVRKEREREEEAYMAH